VTRRRGLVTRRGLFFPREDAGPTGGVWSALGTQTDHVDSESQVVDAVIAFANGDIRPGWFHRTNEDDDGVFWVYTDGDHDGPKQEPVSEGAARQVAEHVIDTERKFAFRILNAAAEGAQPLVRRLRAAHRLGIRTKILLQPTIKFRSNTAKILWVITGPTHDSKGWALFAGGVLAGNPHGDQTDIGRCQLKSCGRFFRIDWQAGHRPRTKYCRPEHRHEQEAFSAAERKRRSRAYANSRKRK
jgi:hypothetical protein